MFSLFASRGFSQWSVNNCYRYEVLTLSLSTQIAKNKINKIKKIKIRVYGADSKQQMLVHRTSDILCVTKVELCTDFTNGRPRDGVCLVGWFEFFFARNFLLSRFHFARVSFMLRYWIPLSGNKFTGPRMNCICVIAWFAREKQFFERKKNSAKKRAVHVWQFL